MPSATSFSHKSVPRLQWKPEIQVVYYKDVRVKSFQVPGPGMMSRVRDVERDIPVILLSQRRDEASLTAGRLTSSANTVIQHTRPDQRVDVFDSQLVE